MKASDAVVTSDSPPAGQRTAGRPAAERRTAEGAAGAACCGPGSAPPLSDGAAAELAALYGALADPVRLRLLSLVAAAGEVCSCDVLEPLGKSQPTVSHHTKVLAEAGLITGDKRGRWVYWSIDPAREPFVRTVLDGAQPATV